MAAGSVLGKGWRFPIRPSAKGALERVEGAEAVRQSVWMILRTAAGERVMRPNYGCGIHELVFEPNTASLRASVRARVQEALTAHEPRIDVLEVIVNTSPQREEQLDIAVGYRVRTNNAVFNLVYPFLMREGGR